MIWTKKENAKEEWHRVFAFFPRKLVDGRYAWLHMIEGRLVLAPNIYGTTCWEYRESQIIRRN